MFTLALFSFAVIVALVGNIILFAGFMVLRLRDHLVMTQREQRFLHWLEWARIATAAHAACSFHGRQLYEMGDKPCNCLSLSRRVSAAGADLLIEDHLMMMYGVSRRQSPRYRWDWRRGSHYACAAPEPCNCHFCINPGLKTRTFRGILLTVWRYVANF